jgi:hypothetical protein
MKIENSSSIFLINGTGCGTRVLGAYSTMARAMVALDAYKKNAGWETPHAEGWCGNWRFDDYIITELAVDADACILEL